MKNIKKIVAVLLVLASCVGLTIAATRNAVDEHSDSHSLIHHHDDFDCDEHEHDLFAEESSATLVRWVTCSKCGGNKTCRTCRGDYAGKCPVCKGKGKYNGKTCGTCNGKKKCPVCKGKKKCTRCNGKGGSNVK